jgi:hypothetical protein
VRVIAPKNLIFKLILVIGLIFSWLYLLSGAYYFGDDFFFLGIPRSPDVISFLFSPIYNHLMPGTKAIYIVLSTISFPSYIGAKVFYVLMALMYAYSIAVVLKYMGMREQIRGLLGAACTLLVFSAPGIGWLAAGTSMFPGYILFFLALAILLEPTKNNRLRGVLGALTCASSLLFWEAYLLFVLFLPFAFLAIECLSDGKVNIPPDKRRKILFYYITATPIIFLYLFSVVKIGAGVGTIAPTFIEIISGIFSYVFKLAIPMIFGYPMENKSSGAPYFVASGTYNFWFIFPLILAMIFFIYGLISKKTRAFFILYLIVAGILGLVITYSRFSIFGSGLYLDPRYCWTLTPFAILLVCSVIASNNHRKKSITNSAFIALSYVAISLSVATTFSLREYIIDDGREIYINRMIAAVKNVESNITILDDEVTMPIGAPWNTNKTLLRPVLGDDIWARGDGKRATIFDGQGNLAEISYQDLIFPASVKCEQILFDRNPLPSEIILKTIYIEISSPEKAIIDIQIENDFLRGVNLMPGTNHVVYQTFGGVTIVNLLKSSLPTVCLVGGKAFVAKPLEDK